MEIKEIFKIKLRVSKYIIFVDWARKMYGIEMFSEERWLKKDYSNLPLTRLV